MSEEQVTKAILKWLLDHEWEIICFDFPQSGTGRLLHPDGYSEKNKDAINPDIVAVKDGTCLFFENKDRYYYSDFLKQNGLINDNHYTEAINELLKGLEIKYCFYGIGLPADKYRENAEKNKNLVDFVVGVNEEKEIIILFEKKGIF